MEKVNLAQKFSLFNDYWQPKIAGDLNDSHIKIVKVKGEFVWHHHDNEDEMFLVVKGRFRMDFMEDAGEGARPTQKTVTIDEGEFIVVPRGVEHKPVADEECWVMLFEPASTLNTGNVVNERTVRELKRL